jgi:hypothetical protein
MNLARQSNIWWTFIEIRQFRELCRRFYRVYFKFDCFSAITFDLARVVIKFKEQQVPVLRMRSKMTGVDLLSFMGGIFGKGI